MAGVKHALDDHDGEHESPYIPQFSYFRTELDTHHDRRERITKTSRDITALSKKIIFSLQRVPALGHSTLPPKIGNEITPHYTRITELFTSLTADLAGPNAHRYSRQISPGLQEYVEAITFQHYLLTGTLLGYQDAQSKFVQGIELGYEDWLLGIFDVVGEVMRWGITWMATTGSIPRAADERKATAEEDQAQRETVSDTVTGNGDLVSTLREWRAGFEGLDIREGALRSSVESKMGVMRTCVEKVEGAVYGMIIRGRERPKGWVPEPGGGD